MIRVMDIVDILTEEQINKKYNLKAKTMKHLKIEKTVYPNGLEKINTTDPVFEVPKGAFEMTNRERNVIVGLIIAISLTLIALALV